MLCVALRSLRTLDGSGTSLWWRAHGRNRQCITANLHMEEGRQVVKELAGKVSVYDPVMCPVTTGVTISAAISVTKSCAMMCVLWVCTAHSYIA